MISPSNEKTFSVFHWTYYFLWFWFLWKLCISSISFSLIFKLEVSKDNISQLGILIENGEKNSQTTYNLNLIDIDKVISNLSIDSSVDLRYYYLSKTLVQIQNRGFNYIFNAINKIIPNLPCMSMSTKSSCLNLFFIFSGHNNLR